VTHKAVRLLRRISHAQYLAWGMTTSMRTTGAHEDGATTAARECSLRSCMPAVVRPCCCTYCCTEQTLTRQAGSAGVSPTSFSQLGLASSSRRQSDMRITSVGTPSTGWSVSTRVRHRPPKTGWVVTQFVTHLDRPPGGLAHRLAVIRTQPAAPRGFSHGRKINAQAHTR
jgi:hypothetical protein